MADVFKRLIRALAPKTDTDPAAAQVGEAGAEASGPASAPAGPEGPTDIRRVSRMTSALDLKNGLEVSEPVPLDELPDELARELDQGSGGEMPTVRIRAADVPRKPS